MKLLFPLLLLYMILAGTGCSKDIRDPNVNASGLKPPPGQSASEAQNPESHAGEDGPRTNGRIDTDYLKLHLKPGMSQSQVVEKFGTGYRQVMKVDDAAPMWRYDYADVGYQFQATGVTAGKGFAQADLDGLRKGMIHMQLFVGWDDQVQTTTYSELYYVDDKAGGGVHQVRLYTVYPDGQTTDQEILAR